MQRLQLRPPGVPEESTKAPEALNSERQRQYVFGEGVPTTVLRVLQRRRVWLQVDPQGKSADGEELHDTLAQC